MRHLSNGSGGGEGGSGCQRPMSGERVFRLDVGGRRHESALSHKLKGVISAAEGKKSMAGNYLRINKNDTLSDFCIFDIKLITG